jgi:hypothetical protein
VHSFPPSLSSNASDLPRRKLVLVTSHISESSQPYHGEGMADKDGPDRWIRGRGIGTRIGFTLALWVGEL